MTEQSKPLIAMIKISCNLCDVTHEMSFNEIMVANMAPVKRFAQSEMWNMIVKHIEGHRHRGELPK